MILGSGLIQSANSWPSASDWLVRDEYTDTVAAGSVNGTAATPGPGTRTVTDTESKISVSGGDLYFSAGKSALSEIDPLVSYGAITRATGVAFITRVASWSVRLNVFGGSSSAGVASISDMESEIRFVGADGRAGDTRSPVVEASAFPVVIGTTYDAVVVLRSSGAFHLVRGGIYSDWTLTWASTTANTATLYPAIANYAGTLSARHFRVIQLPAPFDSDAGLATDTKSGSVAQGTTFSHEADFVMELTVDTLPTSGNIWVFFRRADSDNFWWLMIGNTGTFLLYEKNAGVSTERARANNVVANGHRIVVVAEGTTIKAYYNNTLAWSYAGAANVATATAGEVDSFGAGGAVSGLIAWPRTLSGTAASILNKVSA